MDLLLTCRLCGTTSGLIMAITEECSSKILTLFRLQIGGRNDRLSCYICDCCSQRVASTWLFYERIQKVQDELLSSLAVQESLTTVSTCSQTDLMDFEAKCIVHPTIESIGNSHDDIESTNIEATSPPNHKDDQLEESEASDMPSECDDNLIVPCTRQGWESYPWACGVCGTSLLNTDDLKQHYANEHHQFVIRFICADCPKTYTKYTTFLSHVKTHRPYLQNCCDVCYKWFPSGKKQESHRAMDHNGLHVHVCLTCGKRYRKQSALISHARCHLPNELKFNYPCNICHKHFATKNNVLMHQRIHAGVRDYTCDQCGKSFVQKINLENHLLTHTSARPFGCTTCGRYFKSAMRLRKHNNVHTSNKPYGCEMCGKEFRERSTLKEHLRIHTGAMPYKCEFCGKAFRFKSVLTTHVRQHTGERPYSCLECQHHFTNWPNYNKHMKRRHGINTSVSVRKPQSIPPTGMPQRNPPGSVLAPPQMPEPPPPAPPPSQYVVQTNAEQTFYPALSLYTLSDVVPS